MKKFIAMIFAGLAAGTLLAGKDNVAITFSTVGPDRYADNTVVADGETYALVWTPASETFAGFNADGTAKGGSKVFIPAPVAQGGHCPRILLQVDEVEVPKAAGTWGVYLLDTRVFQTEDVVVDVGGEAVTQKQVKLDANGQKLFTVGGNVTGYGLVAADIGKLGGSSGKFVKASKARADGKRAKIRDMKILDDYVYLYVSDASPDFAYVADRSETLAEFVPTGDRPVMGSASGDTVIITKKRGEKGFFKVEDK